MGGPDGLLSTARDMQIRRSERPIDQLANRRADRVNDRDRLTD